VTQDKTTYLAFEKSPFYAEMGGQVGDSGTVLINDQTHLITDVGKRWIGSLSSCPQIRTQSF
jgi:alanyl-tRNA synthetase